MLFEEHQHHGYMTLTVDVKTISGVIQSVADGSGKFQTPGPTHTFSYPATSITLAKDQVVGL